MPLTMTCESLPSQWEGKTKDGRNIYVRYRFGKLKIYLDCNLDCEPGKQDLGKLVFEKNIGNNLDGSMTDEELMPYLAEAKIKI